MSQLMWKMDLSHIRTAKAKASLRIRSVSTEPSLFAVRLQNIGNYMKLQTKL